jgi:hypothetical protein
MGSIIYLEKIKSEKVDIEAGIAEILRKKFPKHKAGEGTTTSNRSSPVHERPMETDAQERERHRSLEEQGLLSGKGRVRLDILNARLSIRSTTLDTPDHGATKYRGYER